MVVMSTLLYGAETWIDKANRMRRLQAFHNRCITSMLGMTRLQQCKERITSKIFVDFFGNDGRHHKFLRIETPTQMDRAYGKDGGQQNA